MTKIHKANEAILVVVITLVCVIAATWYGAASYYQSKYQDPGIDDGDTVTWTFKTDGGQIEPYGSVSFKPMSGEFDYTMKHTYGNSSMRYSAYFKNVTDSYFTTLYSNGYLSTVGVTYGRFGHKSVQSYNTYNFKIAKNNYWTTGSEMLIDYIIH